MRSAVVLIIAMLAGSLAGCATSNSGNSERERAAAKLVLDQTGQRLGELYPAGVGNFEMGALEDGVAVLLADVNGEPLGAAFWVQDSKVFAVNDAARALNTSISAAPGKITEERVLKCVH